MKLCLTKICVDYQYSGSDILLFAKGESFLITYNKNGIKGRVTIKAKTKQDATEKFNKKFGFVNEFSIEKVEDKKG